MKKIKLFVVKEEEFYLLDSPYEMIEMTQYGEGRNIWAVSKIPLDKFILKETWINKTKN